MTTSPQPLITPLPFELPVASAFSAFNFLLALLATLTIIAIVRKNPWRATRPALIVATLLNVFYQWPAFAFSDVLTKGLGSASGFTLGLHAVTGGLIAWVWKTTDIYDIKPKDVTPSFKLREMAIAIGLVAVSSCVYLAGVPLECTALYALAADSRMMLVAREFSIKLLGSAASSYAFGAMANTAVPIVLAIAAAMSIQYVKRAKTFLLAVLWLVCAVFCLLLILLAGAKGHLIPSAILLASTGLLWNRTWRGRIATLASTFALLGASMVLMEVAKERHRNVTGLYDFPACVVQKGLCHKSIPLTRSLKGRDMSLGLTLRQVDVLEERLVCACMHQSVDSCRPLLRAVAGDETNSLGVIRPKPRIPWLEHQAAILDPIMRVWRSWDEETRPKAEPLTFVQAAKRYVRSIVYRAFVTPLQVASWHVLYAEEHPEIGLNVLPISRQLATKVNVAEKVYERFGRIYSAGDNTEGSTAPTSFLILYFVFGGIAGALVALACVVAFDLGAVLVLRRLPGRLLVLGAGLMGVIALNFMLSDFATVMLSHGALLAFLTLTVFLITNGGANSKRALDIVIASLALAAFAIPGIVLALLIRVRMGSPVVFRQTRPGLHGRPFEMLKFRSMTDQRDKSGRLLPDDERLTSFGRFLRQSSLDELPELLNVIKGDMSLVGPRPLLMEYLPLYSSDQSRRHDALPGLTGWAQINGRNAISWEEKFRLDTWYVDNQSLWLDCKILILTLKKVLVREGINADGHATTGKFTGSMTVQDN